MILSLVGLLPGQSIHSDPIGFTKVNWVPNGNAIVASTNQPRSSRPPVRPPVLSTALTPKAISLAVLAVEQ